MDEIFNLETSEYGYIIEFVGRDTITNLLYITENFYH